MIRLSVHRLALILAAATACYGLAGWCDLWPAVIVWAGLTAAACALGAVLLRTSKIGEVTWRNRVAGCLIPWGWRLSSGKLWVAAAVSWVVWLLLGGATATLHAGAEQFGIRMGLLAAWVTDTGVTLFALGSIRQATRGSRVGALWVLAAVAAALTFGSAGLYLCGSPVAALVVAGGPPLVVGGCFGLVMLFLVTVGRNTRWN